MNHDKLLNDWFDNKLTTPELIHEVKTLRELLERVILMLDRIGQYDDDLYHSIKKHLQQVK